MQVCIYLCFNKLKQILKMRSYSCILKVIVVYALLGIVIASCIDKDTDYSRPDTPQTPNDFDYSTTQQVQLNVQYEVPEGYQVLFDVYFENPFEIDEEGQAVKRTDVVPKVTRMTDGMVNMPAWK